ncbi:MAG: diacylglycerol kinase family protein [Coriobacteriia bacterium]|nr:diacylglycerol kinase family protein [Coriobacteriia bacterium]
MGDASPDNKPFVRSAETKGKGQRYKLTSAFANAGRGLFEAIRSERNLRIDVCVAVVAIALGFALRIDTPSWLAVIICIGMMFALETVNTAIEAVVDLASPGYHELARRAKDCAAGAALAGAFASLVVGCIVYIPPILAFMAS